MFFRSILLAVALSSCASYPKAMSFATSLSREKFQLVDGARQRTLPIVMYGGTSADGGKPLAVLSHGYGGQNFDYTFLTFALVRRGYVIHKAKF